MNKNFESQPNIEDKKLESVLHELSSEPTEQEVGQSFRAAMDTVTKLPEHRIHEQTQSESTFIKSPVMFNIRKIMGATAATLALVLVVGYVTFNGGVNEYDDIYAAALGEEGTFEIPFDTVDDFSDIYETETVTIDSVKGSSNTKEETSIPNTSNQNKEPATVNTTNSLNNELEEALLAIDSLFTEDNIDYSGVEEWFADTSAAVSLTQSYGI